MTKPVRNRSKPSRPNPPRLPPWVPPRQNPQAGRGDINGSDVEQSRRYASVSAEGTILPIIYGEDYVGPIVSLVTVRNGNLYLRLVWCVGEIDAVASLEVQDGVMPAGVIATHYTGTTAQGVDPTLAAAIPGYNDRCVVEVGGQQVGVAYSVVVVPPDVFPNFPRFVARIRGLKVRDPRNAEAVAWSDNPALILAHFIEEPTFGMAGAVNRASLIAAANHNDELVSGSKRHRLGLTMAQSQPPSSWVETLRAYARCFVVPRGDEYVLVPDKAGSSVGTLALADYVAGTFSIAKRSLINQPNVVKVFYTSKAQTPWTEDMVEVVTGAVQRGEEFRRESVLRMPGISDRSQALRFAIERLNDATLIDLSGSFQVTDKNWKFELGDILSISHPVGLTDKLVRVTGCDPVDRGIVGVSFVEYDANVYSDQVAAEPPPPDSGGQTAFNPPAVVSLAAVERFYTSGLQTSSEFNITWDCPAYPFLAYYRVEVDENGRRIATVNTTDKFHLLRGLVVGARYSIRVFAMSVAFVAGLAQTLEVVAQGDTLPPDFSQGRIVAYEAGDSINAYVATGATDIDLWGYEWRVLRLEDQQLIPPAVGGPGPTIANWQYYSAGAPVGVPGDNVFAYSTVITANPFTTAPGIRFMTSAGIGLDEHFETISAISWPGGTAVGDVFELSVDLAELAGLVSGGTVVLDVSVEIVEAGLGPGKKITFRLGPGGNSTAPASGVYTSRTSMLSTPSAGFKVKVTFDHISGSASGGPQLGLGFIKFRKIVGGTASGVNAQASAADWAAGTLLARSAALNVRTDLLPSGVYRVLCRALDSVRGPSNPFGQYSPQIQAVDVQVRNDQAAILRNEYVLGTPTTNMTLVVNEPDKRLWAGPGTGTWNSIFSSSFDSNTAPVYSYFGGGALAYLETQEIDAGQAVPAQVINRLQAQQQTGAPVFKIMHKLLSGDPWTEIIGRQAVVNARYFKARVEASAAGVALVAFDDRSTAIELNGRGRTEQGTVTTAAAGGGGVPVPVTVTLQGNYSRVLSINLRPVTSEPIQAYVDNISLSANNTCTFTVVATNLRGLPVSTTLSWEFTGI